VSCGALAPASPSSAAPEQLNAFGAVAAAQPQNLAQPTTLAAEVHAYKGKGLSLTITKGNALPTHPLKGVGIRAKHL